MLGSIAAISLLVRGIGVMNIMLMTVRERTRETCDRIVRIPFAAEFGSLNVSNAAAVALYAPTAPSPARTTRPTSRTAAAVPTVSVVPR